MKNCTRKKWIRECVLAGLILLHCCPVAFGEIDPQRAGTREGEGPKAVFRKFKEAAQKNDRELVRSLQAPADREVTSSDLKIMATLELLDVKISGDIAVGVISGPGETWGCDDVAFVRKGGRWLLCLSGRDEALERSPDVYQQLRDWFNARKKVFDGTSAR